jgi:hypothetical protein
VAPSAAAFFASAEDPATAELSVAVQQLEEWAA